MRIYPASLDTPTLEIYWEMVAERQEIWHKRFILKQPPPWTSDKILQRCFFTNMYRELDPATEWLRTNILETDMSDADIMFNTIMFRFMGSQERNYQHVGIQRVRAYNVARFYHTLKQLDIPFGDAYTVYANVQNPSISKVENVAKWGARLIPHLPFIIRMSKISSPMETYTAIKDVEGMGPFLSYQVVVDLLYPDRRWGPEGDVERPFLQGYTRNDLVVAGPGAKRGIDLLLNPVHPIVRHKPKAEVHEAVMRYLHRQQKAELVGLSFKWLHDEKGKIIPLWLSDIQNTLCEFSKYMRVLKSGRVTRKYRGGIGDSHQPT